MAGLLLDTGALYALADRDDKWHARMVAALKGRPGDRIVPVTVLTEACYLLGTNLGSRRNGGWYERSSIGSYCLKG